MQSGFDATFEIVETVGAYCADTSRHDQGAGMVQQMLAATNCLAAAQSDTEKNAFTSRCDGADRKIDALVYDLNGLTAAGIRIVEAVFTNKQ